MSLSYVISQIGRVNLSTVGWNLGHNRVTIALSRFFFGLAAFVRSGWRTITPDFWKGFRAQHAPGALHFVMQDNENNKRNEDYSKLNEGQI
jgi:hypothetical protein